MALKKCPRCELNYILDDAPYCPVCTREVKGEQSKESLLEMCSVCNENPALPGKDMCLFCLKEMEGAEAAQKASEAAENPLDLDDASEMEEIAMDEKDDIPDGELGVIDRELSLDDVLAEEEEHDDEEKDEEDM